MTNITASISSGLRLETASLAWPRRSGVDDVDGDADDDDDDADDYHDDEDDDDDDDDDCFAVAQSVRFPAYC